MATPIVSQSISQFQLARYVSLASQLEALKAEQATLQQQLIAALGSGAEVEAGARSASLKTCERRSVSWRSDLPPRTSPPYIQLGLVLGGKVMSG